MPSEHTPLIQTVAVAPRPAPRYPHATTRRVVTVVLLATLVAAIVAVAAIPPRRIVSDESFHRGAAGDGDGNGDVREQQWEEGDAASSSLRNLDTSEHRKLKEILLQTPDAEHIVEWSRYYTAGPHLAGKNLSQALWTRDLWRSFGVQAEVVPYEVYINYPVSSRLALVRQTAQTDTEGGGGGVLYECSLEEDVLADDPTTGLPDRIPTFHGYSASGNVTARYVYVNFGTVDDFRDLVKAGVPLKDTIAIAKYGRNFRGIKVQLAQDHGMAGVVMYDDPQQDGHVTEINGHKPYPHGPARNPSSLQRGSVQFLSTAPGDPTTIGYPSKPGAPRTSPNATVPRIPSLAISYQDAVPLLKALNGHGPSSGDFNRWWQGGGLSHLNVTYNIGPSAPDTLLNLVNDVEYTTTPIWNVIGTINGSLFADQAVLLGNHRDAWIAGGAGDPNSGSAVLNEVVRGFGRAMESGWRPQRTVVFGSWDGEEYGLLGSTEWVEEYVPWLKREAVAYVNVDVAASGPVFTAAASPMGNHVLRAAARSVRSPNQTVAGQSIYDAWRANSGGPSKKGKAAISTLGSGSDYTAFQDFAGVSSINVGFVRGAEHPVYHYHSNYDSFEWMSRFGDPGFAYHVAAAKLLSVLVAELVETPIPPLTVTEYARGLLEYVGRAEEKLRERGPEFVSMSDGGGSSGGGGGGKKLARLHALALRIEAAAVRLDRRASAVMAEINDGDGGGGGGREWWRWLRGRVLRRRAGRIARALRQFERAFLHEAGLDGRPWFKHVVYAPGRWTGYAGATLPGLAEAIEDADEQRLAKWEGIIADIFEQAERVLAAA